MFYKNNQSICLSRTFKRALNIHRHHFSAYFTSNIMIESKRKLKLNQSKDWVIWLSIIRVKVIDYQIWNLINSSTEEKSEEKSKLIKLNLNVMSDNIFTKQHARFKIAQSDYKRKLQKQKKQKETMRKIISFIYDIISIFNLIYIQKMKIHSWDVLRAL